MYDSPKLEDGHRIPPETPSDLFRITRAFQYSKTLISANEIGVFTELASGPMSAGELAGRTGIDEALLEKLLIACAAMGILVTDGVKFSNSLVSGKYLIKGTPEYKGDAIRQTGYWWERYDDFGKEISRQYRGPGRELTDEDRHRRFILAMHELSSSGEARLLADAVDLTGRRKLLDLGGGPGTYSITLCRKYPELAAVEFDLPETEPIFREIVNAHGMTDRISFLAGDLNTDPFGDGYDVALVSNMMHGYAGDVIPPKVLASLVPGGLILVQDFVLRSDKDGPLSAALFNLGMGAYTEDELIDHLQAVGFADPKVCDLGDHMLIQACKPTAGHM